MSYSKKAWAALLLAMATMALVGAGNAAASQSLFCKANETPCASGNHYPSGTEVVLKATGPITWTSYREGSKTVQISCESGEFKGKTTTTGGGAQTVEVTFTTQTVSGCSCPFTSLVQTKMQFNWVSGTMNAAVTSQGPAYSFHCTSPLFGTYQCTYEGEFKEGASLTGGNPAVLSFKEAPVPVVKGGLLCGTEAKLNAEFDVSTPKPLYVSNA